MIDDLIPVLIGACCITLGARRWVDWTDYAIVDLGITMVIIFAARACKKWILARRR